jgi:UDP-N-acetylglucosamine 2-epimerase (non-hydrolysing)
MCALDTRRSRSGKRAPERTLYHAILGTRPEAIKLAPVINELSKLDQDFALQVVTTSQQRDICRSALACFGIKADVEFAIPPIGRSLTNSAAAILQAASAHFATNEPDVVIVQGDTTTAVSAAIAAYYQGIPVVHVEAGLRSGALENPFPEEGNRRAIDSIATLCLPPTLAAQQNLVREGHDAAACPPTGNTVVDALQFLMRAHSIGSLRGTGLTEDDVKDRRLIVVTTHRRESWGHRLRGICRAVREIVETHPDVVVAFPMHTNPHVRTPVVALLDDLSRIHLLPPLNYLPFLSLLHRAYLVLTDSGGIQEETPSFGVPTLILRQTTDRPETVQLELARIVGTDPDGIVSNASELLADCTIHRRMAVATNPFGDGRASQRIVKILRNWRAGRPLLEAECIFKLRQSAFSRPTASIP